MEERSDSSMLYKKMYRNRKRKRKMRQYLPSSDRNVCS